MRALLKEKIEFVSKSIFERYSKEITEIIGDSFGIYALYDENELYYVGKSRDLKKRVQHHLKDRHGGAWTHFSLYLTRTDRYINAIESIIISIALGKLKGNKVTPKNQATNRLKKILKEKIKQKHNEELIELGLGGKRKNYNRRKNGRKRANLKGLFKHQKHLIKKFKGRELKATLLPSGKIKFKNKLYKSATGAAMSEVNRYKSKKTKVNGLTFWYIQDEKGNWVYLKDILK